MPDIGTLSKLELYEQGSLVATSTATKNRNMINLDYKTKADHGTWFVLLAYGKEGASETSLATVAATAPIYVSVDGDGFCKLSEVPTIVKAMNKAMDSLLTDKKTEIPFEQENAKEIDSAQRTLLKARIEKAKGIYKDMVEQAKKGRCMGS